MPLAEPAISVVLPCFNCAGTVAHTLRSLQSQICADWEAVCADDGSTDATRDVLDQLAEADERIRVIRGNHGGVAATRNLAAQHARAPRIVFLDPDDLARPETLATLLSASHELDDRAVVTAGFELLTESGVSVGSVRFPATLGVSVDAFLRGNRMPCMALVPAALLGRRPFDESLGTCEDWDLWLRLAHASTAFATVPRVLFGYRLRAGSLSHRADALYRGGRQVLARWLPRAQDPSVIQDAVHTLALRCGALALAGGSPGAIRRYFRNLPPLEADEPFFAAAAGAIEWAFQFVHGVTGKTWQTERRAWCEQIERWLGEGPVSRYIEPIMSRLRQITIDPHERLNAAVGFIQSRPEIERVVIYGVGTNGLPLIERLRAEDELRGRELCVADDFAPAFTFAAIGLPRVFPDRWSEWPRSTLAIITSNDDRNMRATLLRAGGRENVDFTSWASQPAPARCARD